MKQSTSSCGRRHRIVSRDAAGSQAAEVKVLTAGVDERGRARRRPAFEKATGHKAIVFERYGRRRSPADRGRRSVRSCHSDACRHQGACPQDKFAGRWYQPGPGGVGVVVKAGAPVPDIRPYEPSRRPCSPPNRLPTSIRRPEARAASMWRACSTGSVSQPRSSRSEAQEGGYVADLVASGEAETWSATS